MPVEKIDHDEFVRRLKAQGIKGRDDLVTVCPMCDTAQSMADLKAAGAEKGGDVDSFFGFSCIGRWLGSGPSQKKQPEGVIGCDWTLGGLLRLHELEVFFEGSYHPRFEVASPEVAQEHFKGKEERLAKIAAIREKIESANREKK